MILPYIFPEKMPSWSLTCILTIRTQSITGWWLSHPSEKYEFVSWGYDIPNISKNKIHVPNHQSVLPSGYD